MYQTFLRSIKDESKAKIIEEATVNKVEQELIQGESGNKGTEGISKSNETQGEMHEERHTESEKEKKVGNSPDTPLPPAGGETNESNIKADDEETHGNIKQMTKKRMAKKR